MYYLRCVNNSGRNIIVISKYDIIKSICINSDFMHSCAHIWAGCMEGFLYTAKSSSSSENYEC